MQLCSYKNKLYLMLIVVDVTFVADLLMSITKCIQKYAISVFWRLNVLCIRFKIQTFCIAMLLIQLWIRVGTVFTDWNHLHDRILLLKRNVGVHTTSLTPTLRSQNSELWCIFVLRESNLFRRCAFFVDFCFH